MAGGGFRFTSRRGCEHRAALSYPDADTSARDLLVRRYEEKVLDPVASAEFGGDGFYNVGLWEPGVLEQGRACKLLVDRLLSGIPRGPRLLLDVGCGPGATTERSRVALDAQTAIGVDIAPKLVDLAQRRHPFCGFAVMDATTLGVAENSVDVLTCVEAAFHFQSRSHFLKEAARVLRPGGRLLLADLIVADIDLLGHWMAPEAHEMSVEAYSSLLIASGFDQVRIEDKTDSCWRAYCRAARDRTLTPSLKDYFAALAERGIHAYLLISATLAATATPPELPLPRKAAPPRPDLGNG